MPSKAGLRDLAESSFTGYRLDPKLIKVEPGFNARDFDSPENKEHVRALANSIKAVGVQNPIVVRHTEGKVILVDGESRLRAVKIAISEGSDIKTVPAIQEAQHQSEEDRIASLLSRNTGKPLNFLERGEVFAKLKNFGWSEADISRKTGITGAHVNNIITLHTAPAAVRQLVTEGKVSPTLAVQMVRDHGKDAVKVLKEAVIDAKESGKGRITPKNITAKKKTKALNPLDFAKREAKQFYASLCDIYFSPDVERPQALKICRNVFEDILGSDWKAISAEYHAQVNKE